MDKIDFNNHRVRAETLYLAPVFRCNKNRSKGRMLSMEEWRKNKLLSRTNRLPSWAKVAMVLTTVSWAMDPQLVECLIPSHRIGFRHRNTMRSADICPDRNVFVNDGERQRHCGENNNKAVASKEDLDEIEFRSSNLSSSSYSLSYGVAYSLGPIAAASVLCWVGVWDLQDTFLFPDNRLLSGLACLAVAVPLTVAVHVFSRRENRNSRSIPFVMLVSLCGIEFWRGIWLIWEACVLPDNRAAQSVIAILVGIGILMSTGHYTRTVVGPSVIFPEDHYEAFELADSLQAVVGPSVIFSEAYCEEFGLADGLEHQDEVMDGLPEECANEDEPSAKNANF